MSATMHEVARTVSEVVRKVLTEDPEHHGRILREYAERLEAVLEEFLPERLARYLARAAVMQVTEQLTNDADWWGVEQELNELYLGALADLVEYFGEDREVEQALKVGDAVRALRRLLS